MKTLIIALFAASTLAWSSCDTLVAIQNSVESAGVLSESDIIAGLKQALEIGTGNASKGLSRENGYFGDPLVKIPFPADAQRAADKLQQLGMGNLVNNFVQRLNNGAEKAATSAAPIFVDAIKSMTFSDARQILNGPNNAATQFFKDRTSSKLYDSFSPIIRSKLDEVNAAKLWGQVTSTYNKIPLVNKVNTDLTDYATNKALDGLFVKLAGEEKQIRENPSARVTELLKKVFG